MPERSRWQLPPLPPLPPLPILLAGALVTLGIGLWMFVDKSLLFVAAIGAFGPGILRELGWLKDKDEFQRQATYRAGYHAYLVGGLAAVLVVSYLAWHETNFEDAKEWIRFVVVVLWLTWLFSSVLTYWGAKRTTATILLIFGSFWAVFVLAHLQDVHWPQSREELMMGLLGTLAGIMFTAPWFALAWLAFRNPRLTGILLFGVAAIFFVATAPIGRLPLSVVMVRNAALIAPMLVCGIALIREKPEEESVRGDE